MKIKNKLILIFIIVIVLASFPLSFYIIQKQSSEKLESVTSQAEINSRILADSVMNIILSNGGDIKASMVDAAEMISDLNPLIKTGLVYADAVLLSKNPEYNRTILAKIMPAGKVPAEQNNNKISDDEANAITQGTLLREFFSPEFGETVFEITALSNPVGGGTYSAGRLIFSKSFILKPFTKLRNLVIAVTGGSVFLAVLISMIFARSISKPLDNLIKGVEIIGGGDFDYRIKINGKGEIRKLSNTFNHLAQILKLEINHLITKNLELEKVNNLKDDFLANVTHELRTPLHGMIGIAESLLAGIAGELDKDVKYNLSLMINSGRRLSSLVNDILDYSQLKHEDISLHLVPIDLYTITGLIISIVSPLLKNKDLKITTDIEPGGFVIQADGNRIQQIMLNLVGNAIKFTDSGSITISAEQDKKNPDEIVITVKDTGIGIKKEDQEKIFELFQQAEVPITRYKTGTGMGLSIAKQLIELHGGRIWVESEPMKGSCFRFTLKKSDSRQLFINDRMEIIPENTTVNISSPGTVTLKPAEAGFEKTSEKPVIMIVDDEPVNLQILVNYLSLEGYNVISLANGRDALDKIGNGNIPDLLILDVMLPIISGYEVCKKIRETYTQGELPVLILTAKSGANDLLVAFEAGANDFITKPVGKAELLARANSLIQLKKSVKDRTRLNLIRQEINIAQRIQKKLLVSKLPGIEEISLALRYYPMNEVGGDFYEISAIDSNRIGVFIADVSGHGIPAAFISAMLKVICNFYSGSAHDPKDFMIKINKAIFNLMDDQFITACYSVIDMKKGKLIQSNAGHWPMILYRKNTKELIYSKQTKMPFGCQINEEYENAEYDLEPNDRLVFYTDGIIEIRNSDEVMFGIDNFKNLVKETASKNLNDFADNIISIIQKWHNTQETTFSDDVTLVALDINKLRT